MDNITIRDIKVFVTAPRGINLVIVKADIGTRTFRIWMRHLYMEA